MAIIVTFDIPGATQAMYEEAADRLSGGRGLESLADWPAQGLIAHITGPSPTGWFVTDVWESEEAFQRFGEVLMPVLRAVGYPEFPALVLPAHKVVLS
ncbi:hypothetical protein [Kitasatospora herbaricolor]|uniref:Antibiotic biosynthesis monooxygenase n=1 Tax=Kitasatospora herbaricolor TaxID=68217 RepID=A0ABZ1W4S0_9ACTN|nr:hypothetical protein [Kitasatospora herbaricolor]